MDDDTKPRVAGFDRHGNWHVPFGPKGGQFAKPGWSGAKRAVVEALRDTFLRDYTRDKPDGAWLTVTPDIAGSLNLPDQRVKVTYSDDRYGVVSIDGRNVKVPWTKFGAVATGPPPTRTQVPPTVTPLPVERAVAVAQTAPLPAFVDPTVPPTPRDADPGRDLLALLTTPMSTFVSDGPPFGRWMNQQRDQRPRTVGSVAFQPDGGVPIFSEYPLGAPGSVDDLGDPSYTIKFSADHPDAMRYTAARYWAHPDARVAASEAHAAARRGARPADVSPRMSTLMAALRVQHTEVLNALLDDEITAGRLPATTTLDDFPVPAVRMSRVFVDVDPDIGVFTEETAYIPNPVGNYLVNLDAVTLADRFDDGTPRLWVDPTRLRYEVMEEQLATIDYDLVDGIVLWEDRVAALTEIRNRLVGLLPGGASGLNRWFADPEPDPVARLAAGGMTRAEQRSLEISETIDEFGARVASLVNQRFRQIANPADRGVSAYSPEFRSEIRAALDAAGLRWPPGWDSDIDWHHIAPTTMGDSTTLTFAVADSRGAPVRHMRLRTAKTLDGQMVTHAFFGGLDAGGRGAVRLDSVLPDETLREWADRAATERESVNMVSPHLQAWIDTMEAMGIDMSTDDSVLVSRVSVDDQYNMSRSAKTERLADTTDDLLRKTVETGLLPFPRSWTTALTGRAQSVAIDSSVDVPIGHSVRMSQRTVVNVPDLNLYPQFADVAAHEFTHAMQHAVDGMERAEMWHLLRRLLAERNSSGGNHVWSWPSGAYGFSDYFGDPYSGRLYPSNGSGSPVDADVLDTVGLEIASTAVGQLTDTATRTDAWQDEELRSFIMGLLALVEPAAPANRF